MHDDIAVWVVPTFGQDPDGYHCLDLTFFVALQQLHACFDGRFSGNDLR